MLLALQRYVPLSESLTSGIVRTGPLCTGVVSLSLNQVMVGWGLPLALQVKLTD